MGRVGFSFAEVPDEILTQLRLAQYQQIHRQIPTLYGAVVAIIIGSAIAITDAFPLIYRLLIPGILIPLCLARLWIWRNRPLRAVSLPEAERHLRGLLRFGFAMSAMCSAWSLTIYFETAAAQRAYHHARSHKCCAPCFARPDFGNDGRRDDDRDCVAIATDH
jgi:predicted signal transduction protein with EAL and GGDEF domain